MMVLIVMLETFGELSVKSCSLEAKLQETLRPSRSKIYLHVMISDSILRCLCAL